MSFSLPGCPSLPAPAPPRSIAVHKRFWRPQECLSLISAADMDAKEAAILVRHLSKRWYACPIVGRATRARSCSRVSSRGCHGLRLDDQRSCLPTHATTCLPASSPVHVLFSGPAGPRQGALQGRQAPLALARPRPQGARLLLAGRAWQGRGRGGAPALPVPLLQVQVSALFALRWCMGCRVWLRRGWDVGDDSVSRGAALLAVLHYGAASCHIKPAGPLANGTHLEMIPMQRGGARPGA